MTLVSAPTETMRSLQGEIRRKAIAAQHCLTPDAARKPRGLNVEQALRHMEEIHDHVLAALAILDASSFDVLSIRSAREATVRRCGARCQIRTALMPAPSPAMSRLAARSRREDRGHVTPCWIWLGAADRHGYGQINVDGRRRLVHVIGYEYLNGPVPDGLELDHLCSQRACWEPTHLEAVTHRENVLRGRSPELTRERQAGMTHCKAGHEFTEENTYRRPDTGARRCNECRRIRDRNRKQVAGVRRRLIPDPEVLPSPPANASPGGLISGRTWEKHNARTDPPCPHCDLGLPDNCSCPVPPPPAKTPQEETA